MQTGNGKIGTKERLPLPTPVIKYDENKYGLSGINQLAEWGNIRKGEFVIMGHEDKADHILLKRHSLHAEECS